MKWFQNLRCATSMDSRSYSTDFSFQVAISLTNFYKAKEIAGLMAAQYGGAKAKAQGLLAQAAPPPDAQHGIDLSAQRTPIARDGARP
jgi:hypothetical protein